MSEPDRFDAQARELLDAIKYNFIVLEDVARVAAALRAEHAEARAIALDEAHSIAYEANAEDIADQIEQLGALIPPAAAPAAAPESEWRCDACGDELASETAQRRHETTWHAAAAPAAETNVCPRCGGDIDHGRNCAGEPAPAAETGHGKLRHWNADGVLCPECFPEAPAAETWDVCRIGGTPHEVTPLCVPSPAPVQGAEALDELAAVLRGKDEMGEKLAKALGVPVGPLGRLVDAAIARLAELETAIRWALGEWGEFTTREPGEGAYWWRTELRLRAKLAARAAPPEGEGK